ncbi:MAG: AEC family transporter, partial [Rhizomicrobium sp.]
MGAIVTNQILILTLLMIIGVVLRKVRILTDELISGLTRLLLGLTMPCLILYSFNLPFSPAMLASAGAVLLYSFAIHFGLIFVGLLAYCRFKPATRHVFQFSTVFSNCGFVGYPVAQGVFGSIGVFYTSIFTIPFNILMWSYGVLLFTGERNLKSILRNLINAPTIAIIVGFLMFVFSVQLPR